MEIDFSGLRRNTDAWREAHGRENGALIDEASGLARERRDPYLQYLFAFDDTPQIAGDEHSFIGMNYTIAPSGQIVPENAELLPDGSFVMANGKFKGRKLVPWHCK
jgi:hypothetical protein